MSNIPKVAKAGAAQVKPEAIDVSSATQSEKENANVALPEAPKDTKAETPRHYYVAERFR